MRAADIKLFTDAVILCVYAAQKCCPQYERSSSSSTDDDGGGDNEHYAMLCCFVHKRIGIANIIMNLLMIPAAAVQIKRIKFMSLLVYVTGIYIFYWP